LYIANAFENKSMMTRLLQILKIIQLFILLPFDITKGSKKKAYMKIKKMMIAANLL
jgi:hypothetical protein